MVARSHGESGSKYYSVWQAMILRCYNPSNKRYHRYGGRGIEVCEAWRTSFEEFKRDMGEKPDGMSIERIDNNKHYTPDNCRWGTPVEQARNTIRNRQVTALGITAPLAVWVEVLGIPYHRTKKRLNRGWSHEQAIGVEDLNIAWG